MENKKSNAPRLSVIVPVYNAEAYLSRCVDSILCQTFTDFELILVDDGSPDCCGQIIDEYAEKDVRVIGVHQENRGVSAARNHGLRLASGQYIGFVDADDWIEPDMYQKMVNSMESNNVDIVSCMFFDNLPDGRQVIRSNCRLRGLVNGSEFMESLYDIPITIGNSVDMKLFRRDLIQEGFDERVKICEDNLFLANYCLNISSGYILSDCFYHVYGNPNSSTRNEVGKRALGLKSRREIIRIAAEKGKRCKEKAERVFLDAGIVSMRECIQGSPYRPEARGQFVTYMKSNFRSILLNSQIGAKTKTFYYYTFIRELLRRKEEISA